MRCPRAESDSNFNNKTYDLSAKTYKFNFHAHSYCSLVCTPRNLIPITIILLALTTEVFKELNFKFTFIFLSGRKHALLTVDTANRSVNITPLARRSYSLDEKYYANFSIGAVPSKTAKRIIPRGQSKTEAIYSLTIACVS